MATHEHQPYALEPEPDGEGFEEGLAEFLGGTVNLLEAAIGNLRLSKGSSTLRLAWRAVPLEDVFTDGHGDLVNTFKEIFLFKAFGTLRGIEFEPLIWVKYKKAPPISRAVSRRVGIGVLSLRNGVRAYFANDGNGHRLLGGGIPNESESADELDARVLEAALDSNGKQFSFQLISETPDAVVPDERFGFDFWLDRFERCLDAADGFGLHDADFVNLVAATIENDVRKLVRAPHARQALLAALKFAGRGVVEDLSRRAQVALWLELAWLRDELAR